MPDKFWNVYNYLARNWYEQEYGQVETPDRWYAPAMIALERLAYQERKQP